MVGTLLIVGVATLILGTLLCMRDAHHRGSSILLFAFPLISLRYVQRHWQDLRWAVLARIAGAAMILLAAGLTLVRNPLLVQDPGRMLAGPQAAGMAGSLRADLDGFVGAEEAIRIVMRADDNPRLSGRIHGRRFAYQRVDWIDGVLVARQGEGFLPDLEVRILFPRDPGPIRERTVFHVTPGDENVPEVHLAWREPGANYPETLIIRGGYRMELQLAPMDRHMLTGFLRLILPDPQRSFLSGDFRASVNHLRYREDGRVDLNFDHRDTLEFVAEQYLETQYPEGAIRDLTFTGTAIQRSAGSGSTSAIVTLRNGRVEQRDMGLERTDSGWAIRPGSIEIRVLAEAPARNLSSTPAAEPDSEEPEVLPLREIEFSELANHEGEAATIIRADGTRQQGVLRGQRRDQLFLEAAVGSGRIEFFVNRRELAEVHLAGGERLLLVDGGRAAASTDDEPVAEAAAETRAVETARVDADAEEQGNPWQEYEGRVVRVSTHEGRTRTGLLKRVEPRQLTLEVNVGAGTLEYFYRPGEINEIEAVETE